MATLARQGVNDCRGTALGICASYGVNSPVECVRGFDSFLRSHFLYRREEQEVLRTVPFMLNDLATDGKMQGDCDDMSIMSSSMFLAVGIQPRMVAIKSTPEEFDHVFCEAFDGSQWVPVDPTVPYGTVYHHFGVAFQPV